MAPAAATAAARAPVAERRPPSWLWALLLWLIFVALLATGYAKLLAACGLALPGQSGVCSFETGDDRAAAEARNRELRQALRDRAARLAALAPCGQERPSPPPSRSPDRGEVEKRLNESRVSHGALDIALAWNGHADLDLHVMTPCGEIMFNARTSCGGQLDRDANGSDANVEDRPVEHVRWSSDPPKGRYQVIAVYFAYRDAPHGPVPFTVVVRDGDTEKSYQGTLTSLSERKTGCRIRSLTMETAPK